MRRTITSVLALGFAAVVLTGCAVSITDEDAAGPVSSPTDASTLKMATDDPRPEAIAPTAPDASLAPDAPSNLRTRAEAISLADTTIACTPGLAIADDGKFVRVE